MLIEKKESYEVGMKVRRNVSLTSPYRLEKGIITEVMPGLITVRWEDYGGHEEKFINPDERLIVIG